jgi:DNA helicase HerA-like ATPase
MGMEKDNDSILKVGTVIAVKGRTIEVAVDKMKNASHLLHNGNVIKNVSVGSYLKIAKGFSELIGKIESEFIQEDKLNLASNYSNSKNKIKRILVVTLVGFVNSENNQNEFKQGLKELPLIENECYLLTEDEFELIHKFAKDSEDAIQIGTLLNETSVPIKLGVDRLFASHIGIFGNTGSGKSYSLAKIYHELFNKYKNEPKFKENAKFVLIDFNGEYVNPKTNLGTYEKIILEEEYKDEFILGNEDSKFPISKESIESVEILSILLDATEKTQKPFIDRTLKNRKLNADNFDPKSFIKNELLDTIWKKETKEFTKETLLDLFENLYSVLQNHSIIYNIKELIIERLDFNGGTDGIFALNESGHRKYYGSSYSDFKTIIIDPLHELIDQFDFNLSLGFIHVKLILNYFYELVNSFKNIELTHFLLKRAKRTFIHLENYLIIKNIDNEKSSVLTIISFKNIEENSIKKSLALIISKSFYDTHKKNENKEKYLNLIIDEAHNILSKSSTRESESWKDYRLETFEEIIKEGRKFGVFLTIASQRPSDISDTIISQLHNYFLHRLINNKDIEAIGRTVSYLDKVSFESLSILPQGACILAGLSADLPVVIKVDKIDDDFKPYNETIELTKHWK